VIQEWEYKTLDDAVKKGSSNISLNKIKDEKGLYPVYGAKGFAKNISFFQQEKEYLAIIKDGAGIGRVSKHPKQSSVLATMQYLIPKAEFDIDFIKYFLNSINFEKYRNGSTIPHIYFKDYKLEPFPVISLPEQKYIVSILDKAFTSISLAIASCEKNLVNARELFESYLNNVFTQEGDGWVKTTVGEQITLQRGFDITKKQQNPGNIPVVSSGGIKSYHDTALINAPGVVIGRKGTLGKVYYLNDNFWPHDTTLWVKSFNENLPRFVYYFLKSIDVKSLDTGTANPALNRKYVHLIQVNWPIASKQIALVAQLDYLSKEVACLETTYKQKLVALSELKQSILQKAFSGQLTNAIDKG